MPELSAGCLKRPDLAGTLWTLCGPWFARIQFFTGTL